MSPEAVRKRLDAQTQELEPLRAEVADLKRKSGAMMKAFSCSMLAGLWSLVAVAVTYSNEHWTRPQTNNNSGGAAGVPGASQRIWVSRPRRCPAGGDRL